MVTIVLAVCKNFEIFCEHLALRFGRPFLLESYSSDLQRAIKNCWEGAINAGVSRL